MSVGFGAEAQAADRRLALLVGHQKGWKKDPQLRYALSGDLRPMARALRRFGFEVITLENKGADAVRRAFRRLIQRQRAQQHYTTFVFYYSGHADQKHFHLGPRGPRPLSYPEFSRMFRKLQIKRRFAIFDSCYSGAIVRQFGSIANYRKLMKEGRHKGVRARRRISLKRMLLPNQGREEGIRIISSSLDLSWELKRYNASVFTHYLLDGLRGNADQNKDGKISIDELFDFASLNVQRETGQKPQQLLLLERSTPYALAPAYRSRLLIGSRVRGKLRVAVANFMWTQEKRAAGDLRLAVVHGKGKVFLKRGQRCWSQDVLFPKGGEAKLGKRWIRSPCRKVAMTSKGTIHLSAQTYEAPPRETPYRLALHAGYANLGIDQLEAAHLSTGIDFRWRFLELGFSYSNGQPTQKQYNLSRLLFHTKLGLPIQLSTSWDVFVGGYAYAGMILSHVDGQTQGPTPNLGIGAYTDLSWWFHPSFGLRIGGSIGMDYVWVPVLSGMSLAWRLQSALLWRF